MVPGPARPREHARAVRGDRDRVLEMGRERAVDGRDRPLVVVDVDLGLAGGDHRLDRERHALDAARGRGRGRRSSAPAGPRGRTGRPRGRRGCGRPRSPPPRRPSGRPAEMSPTVAPSWAASIPASSAARQTSSSRCASGAISPTREGRGRVGDHPVLGDADVEGDDVALARAVGAGDAVHDHVVGRDAGRGREALVALRGRDAAVRADVLVGEPVELGHRDRPARAAPRAARASPATTAPARGHQLDLACASCG